MWSLTDTDIIFAVDVMFIHKFKQLDFNLSLIEEWLLVLNDLDSYLLLVDKIVCFDHLPVKTTSLSMGQYI